MKKPIKAISNVIELKPGMAYLLVFKMEDISRQDASVLVARLRKEGINCLGIAIRKADGLEVIEAPKSA
jgi:hypothetical protein